MAAANRTWMGLGKTLFRADSGAVFRVQVESPPHWFRGPWLGGVGPFLLLRSGICIAVSALVSILRKFVKLFAAKVFFLFFESGLKGGPYHLINLSEPFFGALQLFTPVFSQALIAAPLLFEHAVEQRRLR